MGDSLQLLEQAKEELRSYNAFSEAFGLTLGEEEIAELITGGADTALIHGGLASSVEILQKLIYAFCDSPFMEQDTYMRTLAQLQEAFGYFRTEAQDAHSDDDLIAFMLNVYNGRAQGSAEFLIGISLDALIRYARDEYDTFDEGDSYGFESIF